MPSPRDVERLSLTTTTVFEDSTLNEKTVAAVEKQIHYGDGGDVAKAEGPTAQEHEIRHAV